MATIEEIYITVGCMCSDFSSQVNNAGTETIQWFSAERRKK